MPAFLLSLVAVVFASIGGRDQRLVADIAARNGQSMALLILGWVVSIATACAMAYAGLTIAKLLPAAAKQMLVAIALLFAAVDLLWPMRKANMAEPTRSLFAIGIVLFVRQFGDASRFMIFAIASAFGEPWSAAIGGAVGGGVAISLGWAMGDELESTLPLRAIRLGVGAILLLIAIVLGLKARGLLG